MKLIILHLERSLDRRRHMEAELSKIPDIDAEIFPAVDFKNLTEEQFNELCNYPKLQKEIPWLTKGAICASYSHFLIMKKIVNENIKCALVVEDDVCFHRDIINILARIEEELAVSEVCLLHYLSWKTLNLKKSSKIKLSSGINLYTPEEMFPEVVSAAGYIITNQAANTLSQVVFPIKYGTDHWAEFKKEGGFENLRFAYPRPVTLAGFKSQANAGSNALWNNITGYIDKNKVPLLYNILRKARLSENQNRGKVNIV